MNNSSLGSKDDYLERIKKIYPHVTINFSTYIPGINVSILQYTLSCNSHFITISITVPGILENDDSINGNENDKVKDPTFEIGETNLDIKKNRIVSEVNLFLKKRHDETPDYIFETIVLFMNELEEEVPAFFEKHSQKKLANQSQRYIPYPALNNFCWSPSGNLTIVRNPRYKEPKFDKDDISREIDDSHENNVFTYLTFCVKNTNSDGKQNSQQNKEIISDGEEDDDYFIEFDKTFNINADDNEETNDFLNFQINKKIAENKQEINEKESGQENLIDYLEITLENHPEIQRKLKSLMDSLENSESYKEKIKNRFEFSSRFQIKDFSSLIFKNTHVVENFLKEMNSNDRLILDHGFVNGLIDTFFRDFPEYHAFEYWIYQNSFQTKKKENEDPVPFYKNHIKLHLFKEILNEIRMSRQKHDEILIKIGILKIVIEIMCFRDVVHTKIMELTDLFNKYQPYSFDAIQNSIRRNEHFTLDLKSFYAIYRHFVDLNNHFDLSQSKKGDSNNRLRPRSKSMTKINRIKVNFDKDRNQFNSQNSISKKLVSNPAQNYNFPDIYRLLNEKESKKFYSFAREIREMLNVKRKFEIRVYLDKIMKMHSNYLFFNKELDNLFKKICNYSSAQTLLDSYEWYKCAIELNIANEIIKCSVCNQRVDKQLYICRDCLHGGHISHLEKWFSKEEKCPKCHTCKCNLIKKE